MSIRGPTAAALRSISVRTEAEAVALMFEPQKTASGSSSNSGCQLLGQLVTSAVVAHGFAVMFAPMDDSAGAASRCCTRRVNYSPAGIATDWRMQANANPCAAAGLERRRKSECNWPEVGTCSMTFRKSQRGCTGEPTSGFAILTTSLQYAAVAD